MSMDDALQSQPYDEPAKVEPPKLDLEAIRAREAKASKGPWMAILDSTVAIVSRASEAWIAHIRLGHMHFADDRDRADAAFIAHARVDVPALLAEVTRQRGVIQRLLDQNGEMTVVWKKRLDDRDEARQLVRKLADKDWPFPHLERRDARIAIARWDADASPPKESA